MTQKTDKIGLEIVLFVFGCLAAHQIYSTIIAIQAVP